MPGILKQLNDGKLTDATRINLVGLNLGSLPSSLFSLKNTLEILEISNNNLKTLPDELSTFTKLRIIFASNNPFGEMPSVLGRCPALEMVGLRNCSIYNVDGDALPQQLRWLILTDNNLQNLPSSLSRRPRLQKLMLSCNKLTDVPPLSDCPNLELVRFAGNDLKRLPSLPLSVAWIAVAGNPMTESQETLSLSEASFATYNYGDFEMKELLGEGASGHIYRAVHTATQQELAVKIFKSASTSDGTPESELSAGLRAGRHPNLLTPLGRVVGHPDGRLAMALPLLPPTMVNLAGPPSFETCSRDVYDKNLRFTKSQSGALISSIRGAVEHLHSRGVAHGDIYAHNVLWDPSTGTAVLGDFGAGMLLAGFPEEEAAFIQAAEMRALAIFEEEIRSRTAEI